MGGYFMALTLIEQHDDLLERFHEIHIFVAKFLHFQNESQFGLFICGECGKQLGVLFQMFQSLIGDQFFFFIPFGP